MSQHENGSLSPIENNPAFVQIVAMSPQQRRVDQEETFGNITKGVIRLAVHVCVIEKEGGSLDDFIDRFGRPFTNMLRLVASGSLNPELFGRFWNKTNLLRYLSRLPATDQQRIGSGECVPMLVIGPSGVSEMRNTDPGSIEHDLIPQVFADNHIRDQHEQAVWLDRRRSEIARPKIPETINVGQGKVKLDPERAVANLPRGGDYSLAELDEICRLLRLGR